MNSPHVVQDCLFDPDSRAEVRLFTRAKWFAASFEFSVPAESDKWSIGFLYHNTGIGSENRAWTYIYSDGEKLFARHITREDDVELHTKRSGPIHSSIVDYRTLGINEMSIVVNGLGTLLTLNDSVVIRVPSSMMPTMTGSGVLCVGFEYDEHKFYSIPYFELTADRLW